MHELAICQALLAQIEDIARERAAKVNRVRLAVGPLSGVEPGLLARAYALACTGTAAEGSELDIDDAPVRVRCRSCGAESAASANRLLCGACGDWHTELASGDELLLLKVELSGDV
jgi:hydrogenase nickel incorporation protein HypA/HybF